jgi:hypothetical protein
MENMGKPWDPDVALLALAEECSVMDINLDDPMQVGDAVSKIFRNNAQLAALGIVNTAMHDPDARNRMAAQKFVIEEARRMATGTSGDPLVQLLHDIYQHQAENQSSVADYGVGDA